MPVWFEKFLPILILLVVITFVIGRLPKIDLGHTDSFRRRRILNWAPLGLIYAFLYMGRYNLKVSKHAFEQMTDAAGGVMMSNADFNDIFGYGTLVYGLSFLINGPLTDRYGGKFAILVGSAGAAVANAAMGWATWQLTTSGAMAETISAHFVAVFTGLYAVNMYFQSFGAVAIVKVNAPWFHVRERGVFGAIFGVLISLGIYFAFDWGYMIVKNLDLYWVFWIPTVLLTLLWGVVGVGVKNSPGEAGHFDFDTADASSGDDGPQLGALSVFKLMLKNPVILTIAGIEFCTGFLRQAIMQWYRTFAKQTDGVLGLEDSFIYDNWGVFLCCAGILGGVIAGVISDRVFQSRRGPVAGLLYGVMFVAAIVLCFTYDTPVVGALVVFMSMAVIGVHGMLSGTASMDFGGRKNVGVAVGIIDGFVYLGTYAMTRVYKLTLPEEQLDATGALTGPATQPENWVAWPVAMVPMAFIGMMLAFKVWNAKPQAMVVPESKPKVLDAAA